MFFLIFGANTIFAQQKIKLREIILIELTTPSKNVVKYEVLINRNSKTDYETAAGGANGGGVNCGDCSPEEFERLNKEYEAKLKSFSYGLMAKAWRMGKNKSNVNFGISVGGENCQAQKNIYGLSKQTDQNPIKLRSEFSCLLQFRK